MFDSCRKLLSFGILFPKKQQWKDNAFETKTYKTEILNMLKRI